MKLKRKIEIEKMMIIKRMIKRVIRRVRIN